jgi:uncharacterized membrane protein
LAEVRTQAQAHTRSAGLDTLRGIAIVAMMAYHFAFDLWYYKLIDGNPYRDDAWIFSRTLILSSFLLIGGFSFELAEQAGRSLRRFWLRWAQIAGCTLLVTAGSAVMFPQSFIYFGVLHATCAMWLITKALRWPTPALLAGAALMLALPWFVQHPFFDTRLTNWVGLVTNKPRTEDYVPLMPWMGVFLLGMATARHSAARQLVQHAPAIKPLAWMGRWSLTLYMIHQPILIGLVLAYVRIRYF